MPHYIYDPLIFLLLKCSHIHIKTTSISHVKAKYDPMKLQAVKT